ncbi:MAG: VRR-NUC domain-containing protein [Desulfobacteraceae bacterium]|nr:VRR-NUC domain-containing protein [Desulfobacteraceae bacterium]
MNSEHDHQVALFQFLKTIEMKHYAIKSIYAIPNGGLRSKAVAGKLKAEGVKSGVLDVHLPCESAWYIGLWVEMKFGKNKLTDNQVIWKKNLEELGHRVVVCYSWVDAANEIMAYLGISGRIE